jgi:uncharacterized protein
MIALLISALTLGLLGSLHCVGMCGPLVMSMPFQKAPANKQWLAVLNYHLGKSMAYGIFGLFAGLIGKGFALFQWQQILSILAGVILLLITLLPVLKGKIKLFKPIQDTFHKLFRVAAEKTALRHFLAFGFLNGFLPCGLVYAAFAGATVSASPLHGFLFMVMFGLGTIPSLTAIILLRQKMTLSFRHYLNRSSYYLSVAIGILLILRGFNLGIPYVSPKMGNTSQQVECCHKPK